MDDTDADGEWSDEDMDKLGMLTGKSEDNEDSSKYQSYVITLRRPTSNSQHITAAKPRLSNLTLDILTDSISDHAVQPKDDPVSLVMDKIDAELEAMNSKFNGVSPGVNVTQKSPTNSQRTGPSKQKLPAVFQRHQTGGHESSNLRTPEASNANKKETTSGSAATTSDALTTEGDGLGEEAELDMLEDLDQISAEQIDRKFKEILWKKKGIRSWSSDRPSTTLLSTGYSTDNDSVRTEDFEAKFLGMMVQPSDLEAPPGKTDSVTKPGSRAGKNDPLERSKRESTTSRLRYKDETFQRAAAAAESASPGFKSRPKSIINRPRSLSLNRRRGDKKTVVIKDVEDDLEKREPVRDKVLEQRELQTERRSRSASPARSSQGYVSSRQSFLGLLPFSELSSRSESYIYKRDYDKTTELTSTKLPSDFARENEKAVDREMNAYRQAVNITQNKVREAEEELRTAREMAGNAKSELMVLEFNRGSASKELERLAEDIARKKGQMSVLDSELHVKVEELKNMRTLGLTMEECLEAKTMKDENIALKQKLRNFEGLHLERDELVRQLEVAKEDLFREQKTGRERLGELQEVIETLSARLEEAENLRRLEQAQVITLEAALKKAERDKSEIIQEKVKEYEEVIAACRAEKTESETRHQRDRDVLNEDIRGLRSKMNDRQMESEFKDSLLENMRTELNEAKSLLDQERQDRQKTSAEQKKVLRQLKKETAAAVLKLKESMFLEKQEALGQLKKELEEERLEAGARSDERLAQLLEDHSSLIAEKDGEITRLQDILRALENDQQVHEAVNRERERAELEKDWQLRQEKEEDKRRTNEIIAALDKEKQTNRNILLEIASLKKELEEQRKQQREASRDKLMAIARTKDQMKEQGIAEIERVKFNLKQEHEAEMDRLKERLSSQDQELSRARSELQELSERERLVVKALENTEHVTVKEINKACQRVTEMIGAPPKAVHPISTHSDPADHRSSPAFKTRSAASTALTNLHAYLDELQYYISELQHELDELRTAVKTVKKEQEEALDNCRLEMDRKRTSDLEKLKEQLLKEHVSEMSNVIRECAEANSQLKTNSQILQRYGDAALLEALQAKDEELRTLQMSLKKWQENAEERFNTQLQLQMAKEREKYQAIQHHATREQKRRNDLQKREIDRLEKELQRLASSHGAVQDSNRFVTSSPAPAAELAPPASKPPPPPPSSSSSSLPATNLRSSQQFLQARIQQLQAENAALRKQRMLASGHLSWSASNLAQLNPKRPISPTGRSVSPSFDPDVIFRLGERIKQGEQEIIKAEERAKMNRKIMNNKMEEMTKLQNTLLIQNQELQELERSYNDLQKHYNAGHGSSTRNLNTTI